jgi:protein SCO1/2
MLYCFHYDPQTGKYGMVIMNVLRVAGAATVLAMGSFMFIMLRRDKRKKNNMTP